MDPTYSSRIGHDCLSLLYNVLSEFLCSNNTMDLLMRDVRVITEMDGKDFSSIRLLGFGEKYDPKKHSQGTEIKAITYSNMQVHVRDDATHIYVILDISCVSLQQTTNSHSSILFPRSLRFSFRFA